MKIHQKAKEHFNNKGNELIKKICDLTSQINPINNGFTPDINATTIYSKDVISVEETSILNAAGKEIGKTFFNNGKIFGFIDSEYKEFEKICENIQKNNSINEVVSIDFIKSKFFKWLVLNYENKSLDFSEYIEAEINKEVKEFEIWIPIQRLYIEKEFNIGDRIAFLIGKDINERKDIVKNFKTIYNIRSHFIHHGNSISDTEEFNKFMLNTWNGLMRLIDIYDTFDSKEDFIESL